MTVATLLLFALTALISIATPGPDVLLAYVNGSRFGVRRAIAGMLGVIVSDFVLVGVVALGLGALLLASERCFLVLKCLGAGYLGWLGWGMLRSKGGFNVQPQGVAEEQGDPRALFAKSFLVAVTNPKAYLFCAALIPQFISASSASWPQYLLIAFVLAGVDILVLMSYASIGARVGTVLCPRTALWLDRGLGALLLLLASALALYRPGQA